MRMFLSGLIICTLILTSCNSDIESTNNKIMEKINYIFPKKSMSELIVERYDTGVIKSVMKKNKPTNVLIFDEKGNISKTYFQNINNQIVGDMQTYFNDGKSEYEFRLNPEDLIFYCNVKKSQIINPDGHPWIIMGKKEIDVNDTLKFYIATPLIDPFKTHVKFGDVNHPKTIVSYYNDKRQMNYKLLPKEGIDHYKFDLKVDFFDKKNHLVYSDSTSFDIRVNVGR